MRSRCSEHKLVGSHSICVPSYGSPFQDETENALMQMRHNTNSPRLVRDSLVWGPRAALNGDPTPITSANNTPQIVSQPNVSQQPTKSEHSCLGVEF